MEKSTHGSSNSLPGRNELRILHNTLSFLDNALLSVGSKASPDLCAQFDISSHIILAFSLISAGQSSITVRGEVD